MNRKPKRTQALPSGNREAKNTDLARPPKVRLGPAGTLECDSNDFGLLAHQFKMALGIADPDAQARLLHQATGVKAEDVASTNCALALLHGIGPRDPLEGLLAVQMVGVHNLAMSFLARAENNVSLEVAQYFGNTANKLLRTFAAQMEALTKYRGKGEQKVTVEHVHVHQGGQAVVGNVVHQALGTSGGGGQSGSSRRTPRKAAREAQEQQSAGRSKQGAEVRCEDATGRALPRPRDEEREVSVPRGEEHRTEDGRGAGEDSFVPLEAWEEIGSGD